MKIDIPERKTIIPRIVVLGVGGAGGNAVNNMINLDLQGVGFVVANTDAQALTYSQASIKIQLGENLTKGLGAGSLPEIGAKAADESEEDILSLIADSHMVFITAGMGGGTGTGAAPTIARMCKERGILTVGVVTKPFHFEGSHRSKIAEAGVLEMQKSVDTLIVIPNQNLFHKATEHTTFADAFKMVDDVLYSGIKSITDLMTMPGLINLDFADIRTIMGSMGKAMMGTGEASGEKRALNAAEAAISNPLLDNASMKGAKGVLINISGGLDMTLFEADEAAQRIKDEVDPDANIIFGSTFDKNLDSKIRVSVVATGIDVVNNNNSSDRSNLFQRLDNNSFPHTVKKASFANQTFSSNDRSNLDNNNYPRKSQTSKETFKSFVPQEPVSPESLEEYAENQDDPVDLHDNIQSTQSNSNSAFSDTDEGDIILPFKIDVDQNRLAGNRARNLNQIPNFDVSTGNNKNQAVSSKFSKSLNSIFNIFNKDLPDKNSFSPRNSSSNDMSNLARPRMPEAQQNTGNDSDNRDDGDLVFSEDILNVPAFLRNRQDKQDK